MSALVPALAMWKEVLLHHTVFSMMPVHHCSMSPYTDHGDK